MSEQNQVYIPSVDAKDLYLSNHLVNKDPKGYSILRRDGTVNFKKFINTLDYSLDLIKIREVYWKVYRNQRFSFENGKKEYSTRVMNVTFKYSVKEFNLAGSYLDPKLPKPKKKKKTKKIIIRKKDSEKKEKKNLFPIYLRNGYTLDDEKIKNGAYVEDGKLIAIVTDMKIPKSAVLSKSILGENFEYQDGMYVLKKNATLSSVASLREDLYKNGFYCDGTHFVRFKRSSGSSRVGKCLFIDEKLYPAMHEYELLGLDVKDGKEIDLAALEAYIALTLSSIIDTIEIDPKSILVIDDYESVFKDRVIATRIVDDGYGTDEEEVEICNSIWDGQSLIDKSILGDYAKYGMVLLRKQFFKSCCFNTNIQEFFKDKGITEIKQLNGFTLAKSIEEIKGALNNN